MGDGVGSDLDPGGAQLAELVLGHDPRPRHRSMRTAEPARDDEDGRGRALLLEQRCERLGVVHEAVVEGERRVARRLRRGRKPCELPEGDEPVTP